MGLKTLAEDFVLGVAGVQDEIDTDFGDPTDYAAVAYGAFSGSQTTTVAAIAAEQAGGVDQALQTTFDELTPTAPKIPGWVLPVATGVFGVTLVGVGYYLGKS